MSENPSPKHYIAVCDDDPEVLDEITSLVRAALAADSAEIDRFSSGETLLQTLRQEPDRYDLLLLDILMGELNGVELARTLRSGGNRTRLVFVTSSREFVLDGYKVEASDYLLKPVDPAELTETLSRLLRRPSAAEFKTPGESALLIIPDDIRWAEAFDHTTRLHTAGGEHMVLGTLGEAAEKLPKEKFMRCHRSYLVNLDYVCQVGRTELHLTDGVRIPISRGSSGRVREALIQNCEASLSLKTR